EDHGGLLDAGAQVHPRRAGRGVLGQGEPLGKRRDAPYAHLNPSRRVQRRPTSPSAPGTASAIDSSTGPTAATRRSPLKRCPVSLRTSSSLTWSIRASTSSGVSHSSWK